MTKLVWLLVALDAAPFPQQIATKYVDVGETTSVWIGAGGAPHAAAGGRTLRFDGERWTPAPATAPRSTFRADGLVINGARVYPRAGNKSWAPVDVYTAEDPGGRVWFASPQGVGVREPDGRWRLFDVSDGLPWDEFTGVAAAPDGSVWLGTTRRDSF